MFDEQGQVALSVIKGLVDTTASDSIYKIDGLAGATLTSNGVTNLLKFWMGENGFGPYLTRFKSTNASAINKPMTEASAVAVQTNFN